MASLRHNEDHFGTGCFVSQTHILTAAKCIETINELGGPNFSNLTVVVSLAIYKILKVHINDVCEAGNSFMNNNNNFGMILVSILIHFKCSNYILMGYATPEGQKRGPF